MRMMLMLALPLMFTGCVTTDREVSEFLAGYYSRADVDAITAQMACKSLARNLVQVARCEVRR